MLLFIFRIIFFIIVFLYLIISLYQGIRDKWVLVGRIKFRNQRRIYKNKEPFYYWFSIFSGFIVLIFVIITFFVTFFDSKIICF